MEFDFSAQDDVQKVPEAFRGFYSTEPNEEGKYTVAESLSPAAQAIVGLNKALKAARTDAKTKAVDLSPLADYGTNPTEIKEKFEAKLQEFLDKDEGAKVNIEKIKQDLAQGFAKETEKLKTRNEALQGQLYDTLVRNEAVTAIAEAKGVPDLLLPFVVNQIKVNEDDGKFQSYVVDGAGDIRYSSVTGNPMSIRELIAEMKGNEKYGRLFESEAPKGNGMKPNAGKAGAPAKGESTSLDKISAGLKQSGFR